MELVKRGMPQEIVERALRGDAKKLFKKWGKALAGDNDNKIAFAHVQAGYNLVNAYYSSTFKTSVDDIGEDVIDSATYIDAAFELLKELDGK